MLQVWEYCTMDLIYQVLVKSWPWSCVKVKWVLNVRGKLNEKESTVPLLEIVFSFHLLNQPQPRLIENENSRLWALQSNHLFWEHLEEFDGEATNRSIPTWLMGGAWEISKILATSSSWRSTTLVMKIRQCSSGGENGRRLLVVLQ